MSADDANPPVPAATVVLLRDTADGLTTLMLERSSRGAFGGMWVFPGGRVEPDDHHHGDADDEAPARRAAVREAVEECALHLAPDELVAYSHWTPPPEAPKRFATWFFLASAGAGDVLVDGHEIRDHAWLTPAEVLERRDRGRIELATPTFVTLTDLATATDAHDAITTAARRSVPHYRTRIAVQGSTAVAMWEGDAGYDTADASAPGARHRVEMSPDEWRLERSRVHDRWR